jgi:hypothetical protein
MANSVRSVLPLNLGLMAVNYGVMGADMAKCIEGKAGEGQERRKEIRKEHHRLCDAHTTTVLAKDKAFSFCSPDAKFHGAEGEYRHGRSVIVQGSVELVLMNDRSRQLC